MHEHPPAKLTYKLIVPEHGALAFGLALSPEVWDYEGKSVLLTFATAPGPDDDARYDWAGWGGLRLLSGAKMHKNF